MTTKYDNSGILFKNTNKQKDLEDLQERFPGKDVTPADYKGNATIAGQEYFMDGYIKQGEKNTFMSFKFKPKTPKSEYRGKDTALTRPRKRFDDDDAPF